MLTKELKIDDYVLSGTKEIYRIVAINKTTYSAKNIERSWAGITTINKNGKPRGDWGEEFFECDDALGNLVSKVKDKYLVYARLKALKEEINKSLSHAKAYLQEIENIEAEYPELNEEDESDD